MRGVNNLRLPEPCSVIGRIGKPAVPLRTFCEFSKYVKERVQDYGPIRHSVHRKTALRRWEDMALRYVVLVRGPEKTVRDLNLFTIVDEAMVYPTLPLCRTLSARI